MQVGAAVAVPVVLALRGDLGAGKSVLARAVARGAGVTGHIPSPTFNLLFRYQGTRSVEVVHLDLYRINGEDDVWELGWRELGEDGEIVLIEWPERAESLLPDTRWDIQLEISPYDSGRRRVYAVAVGQPPVLPPLPSTREDP